MSMMLVALRKESVDRNVAGSWRLVMIPVALRKESVDRNIPKPGKINSVLPSLSARRAWIEIRCLLVSVFTNFGRSPQGERG